MADLNVDDDLWSVEDHRTSRPNNDRNSPHYKPIASPTEFWLD
ncbi:MAG: hypothetical protein NT070_21670 [Cyanobacteria bacterium]|nr:hypothetical protein [Cyanobacteriota bacterium]